MFSKFFIHRPIFASVISLLIFIAGLVTALQLPIEQFPDIVPPSVTVSCNYPGADAETLSQTVAVPIESQVNGVDKMIYMNSTCSNNGSYTLNVYFETGTDPDMNTVNVLNRVNLAEPRLPSEVTQTGVTVKKRSSSALGFYSFQLSETAAASKDKTYLSNYVSINIKDLLSRIDGVGEASIMDAQDFSMRIWLDTEIMAQRDISINEVANILSEQNRQVAAGGVGNEPAPDGQLSTLILTTKGRLQTAKEFEELVLRTDEQGRMLKLKDIARIELARQTYALGSYNMQFPTTEAEKEKDKREGLNATIVKNKVYKTAVTVAVYAAPGANAVKTAQAIAALLKELKPELDRAGIEYVNAYDSTVFISASLEEVGFTLILTILIVVAVVYIFLQDWRAAIIPSLTIPVSLVGTFFMMGLCGFTINTLTLFGLCLVIGIVVDDAIVVVENCQRLLDEENVTPIEAAEKSMYEVSGPIVATTCVLLAVFLPTAFISGLVGILYQQFALTIAGSVVISALCALTIAPALCAIFLRKSIPEEKKFFGFRWFNYGFNGFARVYESGLHFLTANVWIILVFWVALVAALVWGMGVMPQGFIPNEDQGVLFVDVKLPDGRSLQETNRVVQQINDILARDFEAEIANAHYVNGYSMIDANSSTNAALGILSLRNWSERKQPQEEAQALSMRIMQAIGAEVLEARVLAFSPPPIMGIGTTGGLEGQLIDKNESGLAALYAATQTLSQEATKTGQFSRVNASFQPTYPKLYLKVDRDKAKKMGINLTELYSSLQGYLGSKYINDFDAYGRVFQVILMADEQHRMNPADVLTIPLINTQGKRVPLSAIATLEETVGPQFVSRFNLYTTAAITAMQKQGESSSVGMQQLRDIAQNDLPEGFDIKWTGMAFQQAGAGASIAIIFVLSLVFGFLVLAAQYESWSAPLIIIMAVPLGVSGAVLSVFLAGLDINLYTQIGLILMVGLSAKNAILITEFARDKWLKENHSILESARMSGRQRLRPIMMTSYAFILGVVPLMFATGAGANSRIAIGTAVFGGMLEETMVGILVSPVLFIAITSVAVFGMKLFRRALGN